MKIKEAFDNPDKIFFTSDTHFGHANIINYCNRPHKDVYEMNQDIVTLWNHSVPEDGIVFHLGDFALADSKTIRHVYDSLHGKKYLLWGNHDRGNLEHIHKDKIYDILEITIKDEEIEDDYQKIVLCHYPILSFHGSHKGWWHLYGHCHGTLPHPMVTAMDVGVDLHGFKPLSYLEVKTLITKRALARANENKKV